MVSGAVCQNCASLTLARTPNSGPPALRVRSPFWAETQKRWVQIVPTPFLNGPNAILTIRDLNVQLVPVNDRESFFERPRSVAGRDWIFRYALPITDRH